MKDENNQRRKIVKIGDEDLLDSERSEDGKKTNSLNILNPLNFDDKIRLEESQGLSKTNRLQQTGLENEKVEIKLNHALPNNE